MTIIVKNVKEDIAIMVAKLDFYIKNIRGKDMERRKFYNKIYTRETYVGTKAKANAVVKALKKKGYLTHISSYKDYTEGIIYEVWKRKK